MTSDEIKALVEKLEKFRQLVQECAAWEYSLVVTEAQDHLLREAILAIEELQKVTLQPVWPGYKTEPFKIGDIEGIYQKLKEEAIRYSMPYDIYAGSTTLPYNEGSRAVRFYKNANISASIPYVDPYVDPCLQAD